MNIETGFYNNPLLKEVNGRRVIPTIISDIDGTINHEELPEGERLGSISHAAEAFAPWTREGYSISLMSSRTLPEIQAYADQLSVNGYAIGEDGGIIALPSTMTEQNINKLHEAGIQTASFDGRNVVLTSATPVDTIAKIMREVEEESGKPIVSTVTSSAEEMQQAAGHHSLEMAQASMVRLASAYAVDVDEAQHALLQARMAEVGIRTLGGTYDKVIQFFGTTPDGKPADKSAALEMLDRIISVTQNVDGMLPVVCGNAKNDIPLWTMALKMGGKAVLIPKEDGTPYIAEEQIPDGVIRATKPAGEGIHEVLSQQVKPWLQSI